MDQAQTVPSEQLGTRIIRRTVAELETTPAGASAHHTQLAPGSLTASNVVVVLDGVTVIGGRYSLPLRLDVVSADDVVNVLLPPDETAGTEVNGKPFTFRAVPVFGPRSVLHAHARQPGASWINVQADRGRLLETAESLGREPRVPGAGSTFHLGADDVPIRVVYDHATDVLARAAHRSAAGSDPEALVRLRRLLGAELLTAVTLALASEPAADIPTFERRVSIVQQARELLDASPDHVVTLPELCRAVSASERAVQYAFRDVANVTPRAYLRMHALNAARNELLAADRSDLSVSDVAMRWGFWHLGRFSQYYRELFGEAPSRTLRYGRGPQPVG